MGARNKLLPPPPTPLPEYSTLHTCAAITPQRGSPYTYMSIRAIYVLPCSIHVYRCYKHFYDNRNALLTNRGYRRSLIILWLPGDDIFECSTMLQRVFGIDMDRSIMFRSVIFQAIIFVKTLHRI